MKYTIIQSSVKDNVMWVTFNRPEALNALNSLFFDELEDLIANISPEILCLVFTGTGKAFVAGADIAEMDGMSEAEASKFSKRGQDVFKKISDLDIPVIASINGYALGGGMELAMSCDIRIASNLAKMGQPEVSLGIIPGYAGTQRLPRLVGYGNAFYLITSGMNITAEQAFNMGLVQKVVEPENLQQETEAIVKAIVSKSPHAVKAAKKVLKKTAETSFEEGSKIEAKVFGDCFNNHAHEGMKAFLEKRKPIWK
ncbi:MAG: enoyl-CoA hydratase/isomerase family protein [Bacteroidales bacterium]|jgi:enoyl-CoA hydratase